jgi:hypothetical protein
VKIELSRDGGTTYSVLAASVPNSGVFSWTVTAPATPSAKVRISTLSSPVVQDESDATFTVPYVGGMLKVSPTTGGFGTVRLGRSKTKKFTLQNLSKTANLVLSAAVTGTGFRTTFSTGAITLGPKKKAVVSVICAPPAAGALTGRLVNTSSDPAKPTLTVPLTATGR